MYIPSVAFVSFAVDAGPGASSPCSYIGVVVSCLPAMSAAAVVEIVASDRCSLPGNKEV
jgi:hypothetical protein